MKEVVSISRNTKQEIEAITKFVEVFDIYIGLRAEAPVSLDPVSGRASIRNLEPYMSISLNGEVFYDHDHEELLGDVVKELALRWVKHGEPTENYQELDKVFMV